ncbi:MAG: hypothetical protein AB7N24_10130 [Dehalococcoidia bacterium]
MPTQRSPGDTRRVVDAYSLFLADEVLDARPWDQLLAIGIVVTVLSVPLLVRWLQARQRERTKRLCAEFGADYDEVVNRYGGVANAERALRGESQRRERGAM